MKTALEYLTSETNKNTLLRFAYTGTKEKFNDKLNALASKAETENWSITSPNSILYSYIVHTFDRLVDENKILFSEDEKYASFNTGLLTELGEDILGLFAKNTYTNNKAPWILIGFFSESDRKFIENFNKIPKLANYFDNPALMYFNPELPIIVSTNHIMNENSVRFPSNLTSDIKLFLTLFKGSVDIMKKKISRNYRLVVPQFYQKKLTYLLPLDINGYKCALAAELLPNGQYRANTVLTLEMAYNNARLLMKPETDWLNIEDIQKKTGN